MQIKFITQFLFQCICSFVHIHELYYCLLKIDITHVDVNLKPRFLIENVYYIVPSPSTSFCWQKIDTVLQNYNLSNTSVTLIFDECKLYYVGT